MAGKTQRLKRRQYPAEFQLEAVRLADSIGINAAADRLGVPRATVGNWARRRRKVDSTAQAGNPGTPGARANEAPTVKRSAAELEAENVRLRRELTNLKVDNEILRKAAAYFAKESR